MAETGIPRRPGLARVTRRVTPPLFVLAGVAFAGVWYGALLWLAWLVFERV